MKKLISTLTFVIFILLILNAPAFALSAGELTAYQNNQNLTTSGVYSVNGNVGIGTTNPGQALDIVGTMRATYFVGNGSLLAGLGGATAWTSSGSNVYTTTGSNNVGIGTSTPQGGLVITNGNVGIGTWAPNTNLQVSGGAQGTNATINVQSGSSGYAQLQYNGSTNGGSLTLYSGGGGFYVARSKLVSNGDYTISSDNNLFVTPAPGYNFALTQGNMGIGTVSPLNNLAVVGNAAIGSSANVGIGAPANGLYVQGNVGIGSTNPSQKLDVTGTVRSVGFAMSGTSPISGYVLTATDTAGDASWATPGTVGGWTTSGNNVYETSGGNVGIGTTIVNQAALTVMNGNVGIGTWAPTFTLTTIGSGYFSTAVDTSSLDLGSGSAARVITRAANISNDQPTGMILNVSSASAPLIFQTGSAERMRIDNNGNIGIGTTTPAGALTVMNGNVGIGTWVPSQPLYVGTPTGLNFVSVDNAGDLTTGHAVNADGNLTVGSSAIIGSNNAGLFGGTLSVKGSISAGSYVSNAPPTNDMIIGGNVGIGTVNPSGGGLIVLPSNTGNVGIGSLNPSQALDVTGTVRSVGFAMSGTSPISGYVLTATDTAGDASWATPGTVGGWTTSGNNVYETSGGNVGIGTTIVNQAALTVMNGNVGIGTWAPANLFQVNGSSQNVSISSSGNIGIGTTPGFQAGGNTPSSLAINGDFALNTRFYFSNPNADSGNAAIMGLAGNTSGNKFEWYDYANTARLMVLTDNSSSSSCRDCLGIGTTTPQGAFIVTNGNVGIGTWVPKYPLQINGGQSLQFDPNAAGGTGTGIYSSASLSMQAGNYAFNSIGAVNWMAISPQGNVGIGTNANQAALSVMNGNVGIGTWVPAKTLAVNGQITIGSAGHSDGSPDIVIASAASSSGGIGAASAQFRLFGGDGNLSAILDGSNFEFWNRSIILSNTTATVTAFPVSTTSYINNGANVGIGTSANINGKFIVYGGNVGIGSFSPGQALDVTGTVRSIGFTMSGTSPISGYVLSATDSAGDATWSTPGTVGGWTTSGNNVYETSGGNVGIGTSFVNGTGEGALTVMNGNVGIGTWLPASSLDITGLQANSSLTNASLPTGTLRLATNNGNTIGSYGGSLVFSQLYYSIHPTFQVAVGQITGVKTNSDGNFGGGLTFWTSNGTANYLLERMRIDQSGNIGMGTITPGGRLQVATPATTPFLIDTNGNVGIGTTTPVGGLAVMNGNVGIGTWMPAYKLHVFGDAIDISSPSSGNVGFENRANSLIFTRADIPSTWLNKISNSWSGTQYQATMNFELATSASTSLDVMTLNAFGNVGIGTFLPNSVLAVSGGVTVGSGYVVNTAPSNGLLVQGNVGIGTTTPQGAFVVTNGNVGIGTWVPAAALDVNGAMYSHSVSNGSTSINWALGNVQGTSSSCAAMTFTNMQDGGSYALTIEGTVSGTCSFTETGLTFKMPANHGATTGGTTTLYGFVRRGTNVFVSWSPESS